MWSAFHIFILDSAGLGVSGEKVGGCVCGFFTICGPQNNRFCCLCPAGRNCLYNKDIKYHIFHPMAGCSAVYLVFRLFTVILQTLCHRILYMILIVSSGEMVCSLCFTLPSQHDLFALSRVDASFANFLSILGIFVVVVMGSVCHLY